MSPRWLDKRTGDHLAMDTGGGPIARLWATALAKLVNIGYVYSTGHSVKIRLPKTALKGEVEFEWKSRNGATRSNVIAPGLISRLMRPGAPSISSKKR